MPLFFLSPFISCAAFLAGLAVGSFLNVVILRGERGQGFGGRSHCDACGRTLRAHELIPIVSFIVQKARCRSCGAVLSWQYPIVEAGTALAFALLAWRFLSLISVPTYAYAGTLVFLLAFPAVAALIVLIVSDFRFQILPDGATAILVVFGIVAAIARGALLADALAALAFALFFAALWFFSRGRWMGFGDAKLVLATSLAVGFPVSLSAFLFSFWLGGISGVVLIGLGKKGLSSRIPFGPFIIAGAAVAYFLSPAFLSLTGLSLFF